MVSLSVSRTIWSDGESKLKAGPAQEHGSEVIDLPGEKTAGAGKSKGQMNTTCSVNGCSSKSLGKWMFILQKAGIT